MAKEQKTLLPEWAQEIKNREANAMPGPWACNASKWPDQDEEEEEGYNGLWYLIESGDNKEIMSQGTASFIAHSRTDIPCLLHALETEMRKVERAKEVILGSIGVFEMLENASTTEDFVEARSCRLSVKLACNQVLKELEE